MLRSGCYESMEGTGSPDVVSFGERVIRRTFLKEATFKVRQEDK